MNPFEKSVLPSMSPDGQMDLFGYVAADNRSGVVIPSPDCSLNGLVHFKYSPLMKKSIRCKGGVLFRMGGTCGASQNAEKQGYYQGLGKSILAGC